MFDSLVACIFIFVYYLYFYFWGRTRESIPFVGVPEPILKENDIQIITLEPEYMLFGQAAEWVVQFPAPYHVSQNRVKMADPCYQKPDGWRVRAERYDLFEYVKREKPTERGSAITIPQNVKDVVHKTNVFYFRCRDNQIESLNSCAPGTVFDSENCVPVNACDEVSLGTFVADVFDRTYFYECTDVPKRKKCPNKEYFFYDSCRPVEDLDQFCRDNPKIGHLTLDSRSYVHCDDAGKPVFVACPSEDQVMYGRECVSNVCIGKRDGERIPMDVDRSLPPFRFFPGYQVCKSERVDEIVRCPDNWDHYLTKEEDLRVLPMVFDGVTCSIPEFCKNVHSDDSEVIVPSHQFSKFAREWQLAEYFDSFVGYGCEGGWKRRMPAKPGERIKRFKFSSACSDNPNRKVVVADQPDQYFDCKLSQWSLCPPEHFFNGESCKKKHPFAHVLNGVDLFRFKDLDLHDDWIIPWDYSSQPSIYSKINPKPPCSPPESIYLNGYNICSHPDCVNFTYLMWFPKLHAILADGHICTFEKNLLLKSQKPEVADSFDFWSQRGNVTASESPKLPCIPGQRVQTGFFSMDSTVYATCSSNQPFVFCPSSRTKGIQLVDPSGPYACVPQDGGTTVLPPNNNVTFQKNQVKRVLPLEDNTEFFLDGKEDIVLPLKPEGLDVNGNRINIQFTKKVKIEYQYRVTFPPNVFLHGSELKKLDINYNFILKLGTGTNKALNFPSYETIPLVPMFG